MKIKSDKQEEEAKKKKKSGKANSHPVFFGNSEIRAQLCMKHNWATCECENYSAQPNEMHGWGGSEFIQPHEEHYCWLAGKLLWGRSKSLFASNTLNYSAEPK